MKIITDDYCFINRVDVPNLIYYNYDVPKEIYDMTFPSGIPIMSDYNSYEFVEVDIKKYRDFVNTIKGIDWIMDLRTLNNGSSRELLELLRGYEIQRKLIIRRFNSMSYPEKRKSKKLKLQCDFVEYKIKTIKDYLYYRLGQVNMEIPEKAKKDIIQKSKAKKITDMILKKN